MPNDNRIAKLSSGTHVCDGAWGTQLRARGWPDDRPVELANLSHPNLVEQLARDYLASGATILSTNTFSANRFALRRWKQSEDPLALARAGAEIARRAAGPSGLVCGVIGPSGLIVALREAPEEHLAAAFGEQATALEAGGADALVLETFTEPAEALLALRAAREACSLPVIACLSYDSGAQRTRTHMGAEAGETARALIEAGAAGVGANCGGGIAHALPALVALRAATELPVWVKPSAGLPDLEEGRPVYRVDADEFGGFVPALLEAGANVIGGCCGTGPEHIRRVAALVASRRRGRRPG